MTKVNLEARLRRQAIRADQLQALRALREAELQLARDKATIEANIAAPPSTRPYPELQLDKLKAENIFQLHQIKALCVSYRLRFLDAHRFKGAIPYEATRKVARLQGEHDTTLQNFKILAAAKRFQLDDAEDPMLFIPLGEGLYYLVHKWGKDLSRWRKLLVYPLQGVMPLFWTVNGLSLLLTACLPLGWLGSHHPGLWRVLAFFWFFKALSTLAIFLGPRLFVNFSSVLWDSPHFNA